MDKKKRIIISVIVTLIVAAIAFYIVLPPLNVQSTDFWGFLTFVIVVFGISMVLFSSNIKGFWQEGIKVSIKGNKKILAFVLEKHSTIVLDVHAFLKLCRILKMII